MWRGMNVTWRDMLICMVFGFLLIASTMTPDKKAQQDVAGMLPPGSIVVELWWDKQKDDDVDLWVQGPEDVPVGYSNKSGRIFNLVRDDLGKGGDPESMNYETAFGRGHHAGEYVVNAMLYRTRPDGEPPVHVKIKVSIRGDAGNDEQILVQEDDLVREGQELTMMRFRIGEDGKYVPNSMYRLHKDLRSSKGNR